MPDDQVIHLSLHSRVSGCNVALESPLKMVLIGVVWIVGRFLAENLFAGFFTQNNSSPNGWEGRSAISFDGSSLDVREVCDSKKGSP